MMYWKRCAVVSCFAAMVVVGMGCTEQTMSVNSSSSGEDVVACANNGKQQKHNKHQKVTYTSVVSTNWLQKNYCGKSCVIVDVRSAAEFASGHIPKSVNIPFEVPFSTWITMTEGLLLEVPEISQLAADLGSKGISGNSRVVLVTSLPTPENPYALASPTRAALTLVYAGMKNVMILDGGYDKWKNEGKPVTSDSFEVTPVSFNSTANPAMFVTMDYVKSNLGKFILIDARDAEVYSGEVIEPFADKPGHIPTARSLPAPSLWNSDGTYKSIGEIKAIVKSVVGNAGNREIIIYCGVGGYASTVWFALSEILDYKKVKVYDGSAQEWVLTNDMTM